MNTFTIYFLVLEMSIGVRVGVVYSYLELSTAQIQSVPEVNTVGKAMQHI